MLKTILAGDGDPSASRWPMGSGREALLVRYHTGHGPIGRRDQVTFEFAAAYRHYHACLMNVVLTGRVDPRHRDMFRACRDALTACEATLRPGRTVGDVFAAHARVLTRAGYRNHMLNACGYTLGATYPPTWMDEPMIYADHPQVLAPGMVFFIHMILLNSRTGLSMSPRRDVDHHRARRRARHPRPHRARGELEAPPLRPSRRHRRHAPS